MYLISSVPLYYVGMDLTSCSPDLTRHSKSPALFGLNLVEWTEYSLQ